MKPAIATRSYKSVRINTLLFIGTVLLCTAVLADTVNLPAEKDNTLYEEGDLSNGAGDHLFTGSTNTASIRRAVIRFDIDGMVANVQQWLDQPASNFGWIIIGNESQSATSKRFDSREIQDGNAPGLEVLFTTAPPVGACCVSNGDCTDTTLSLCLDGGGVFQSAGSICAQILECPVFEDGFEDNK
jgi:hypothetical protein